MANNSPDIKEKLLNPDSNRFIGILIKSTLWYLTNNIMLYNKPLKHIIVNTGDEYMYLEAQNYKYIPGMTVSPYGYKLDADGNCLPCQNYTTDAAFVFQKLVSAQTNEDHVYFDIPRGNVDFTGVSIVNDQITAPYSRGIFEELGGDGAIHQYSAEFRRLPISIDLNITYYLDSFNDVLILTEKLLSHFAFIKNFYITYLGREIICSLTFPESVEHEKNTTLEFDTENRNRKITLSLTLNSSLPVINERTKVETNKVITGFISKGVSGTDNIISIDSEKEIIFNTPPETLPEEKVVFAKSPDSV